MIIIDYVNKAAPLAGCTFLPPLEIYTDKSNFDVSLSSCGTPEKSHLPERNPNTAMLAKIRPVIIISLFPVTIKMPRVCGRAVIIYYCLKNYYS